MREVNSFSEANSLNKPTAPYRQLLILIGLICVGYLLGGIISLIIIALTPGASAQSIINGDPHFISTTRLLQVIGSVCLFGLPALGFNRIVKVRKDFYYFKTKNRSFIWLLIVLLAFAALPATDFFSLVNKWIPISPNLASRFQHMEDEYNKQVFMIVDITNFGHYLMSLFIIALLPAIFEELIFRGALQQVLEKWFKNAFWAILISSILFSVVHLSYFGFLPRLFLGILLGYVYYLGRDIKLNMLIHFINNAVTVTILYITAKDTTKDMKETMNQTSPFYLQILGLIVIVIIFYQLRKRIKSNHPNIITPK